MRYAAIAALSGALQVAMGPSAVAGDLTIGIDFTGAGLPTGGVSSGFGGSSGFPVTTTGGGNLYQEPPNADTGGEGEVTRGSERLIPTIMIMFPMFQDMAPLDRPDEFDVRDFNELAEGVPFPPIGDECYGRFGHESESHLFVEFVDRRSDGIAWIDFDAYKGGRSWERWKYGVPDGHYEVIRAPVPEAFTEKIFMACRPSQIPDDAFFWRCEISSRIAGGSAGGQINYRVSYPLDVSASQFDSRTYKGRVLSWYSCIQIHEQE